MKQQRNSRQRQMVLDAVNTRCDHPTADQIYLDVRSKNDKISRGTVYRNLGVLSDGGEVANVKVPSADRYDSGLEHHYHTFCTSCGGVFDAPLPYHKAYDLQIARQTDFQVTKHRMLFEGLCPACLARQKEK